SRGLGSGQAVPEEGEVALSKPLRPPAPGVAPLRLPVLEGAAVVDGVELVSQVLVVEAERLLEGPRGAQVGRDVLGAGGAPVDGEVDGVEVGGQVRRDVALV